MPAAPVALTAEAVVDDEPEDPELEVVAAPEFPDPAEVAAAAAVAACGLVELPETAVRIPVEPAYALPVIVAVFVQEQEVSK